MAYKPYQEDRRTCGERIGPEIQRLERIKTETQRLIDAAEKEIIRIRQERNDPTIPEFIRRETSNTIRGIEDEIRDGQDKINSLTRQIIDLQNDLYIRRCSEKFYHGRKCKSPTE